MRKQVELIFCDKCGNRVDNPRFIEVNGIQGEYCRSCVTILTKTCGICNTYFPNATIGDNVKEFNCSTCLRRRDAGIYMDMLRSGSQFH